jgi:RecB family exonuclease
MLPPPQGPRAPLQTVYSHSRIDSFEKCAKKFHFRYVLELPADSESIEAFVGKRVHEVLERLYVFVGQGMLPGIEKVLARYRAFWDDHYDASRVRIVREGTKLEDYKKLGERCLRGYYREYYPFDADETLSTEERIVFDLDDEGKYAFQGILDRLVRAPDGTVEIHDYKTGRWVPTQKQLDEDRQLALYQIGVAKQYGDDAPIRLVWHYLQRGKRLTSTRTPAQIEAVKRAAIAVIDRIGVETEYAPTKSRLCDWCEYKSICPAFGGSPVR